jgi:hypothetical protein
MKKTCQSLLTLSFGGSLLFYTFVQNETVADIFLLYTTKTSQSFINSAKHIKDLFSSKIFETKLCKKLSLR